MSQPAPSLKPASLFGADRPSWGTFSTCQSVDRVLVSPMILVSFGTLETCPTRMGDRNAPHAGCGRARGAKKRFRLRRRLLLGHHLAEQPLEAAALDGRVAETR